MDGKELLAKYSERMEARKVKVHILNTDYPVLRFEAEDDYLAWSARNTLFGNTALLEAFCRKESINFFPDRGNALIPQASYVYGVVAAPLESDWFECAVSDFWRERQAVCYADRLPCSFSSVWMSVVPERDYSTYWLPEYRINPLKVFHEAAKDFAPPYRIVRDSRNMWHACKALDGEISLSGMYHEYQKHYGTFDALGLGWHGRGWDMQERIN